jgi:arabinogalactan endo-1,4-beta-galactosidase
MNINEAFPSKYLKASDLGGSEPTVTISHVTVEEVGETDRKPVIYFAGKEKGIVLNKTNATNIGDAYGPDTDEWTGKKVTLFTAWVDFNGRSVEAIRIRPAKAQAKPNPQFTSGPPPADPGDPGISSDDIPF